MNELEKQNIINSFNEVVDAYENYRKKCISASMFNVCAVDSYFKRQIHISQGIENLAEALSIELLFENDWADRLTEYSNKYSFEYKGYTIFQLTEKPLELSDEIVVKVKEVSDD